MIQSIDEICLDEIYIAKKLENVSLFTLYERRLQ